MKITINPPLKTCYNMANKYFRIRRSGTPSSRYEKYVLKGGDEGVPAPRLSRYEIIC